MQFNSFIYILLFLPCVVLCWHGLNRIGNVWAQVFLILASLVFYGYSGINGLSWFLASAFFNYLIVLLLHWKNNKILLGIGIAVNVMLLFCFKYYGFATSIFSGLFIRNELLRFTGFIAPLGISFFTFQQISYLVDTYQSKASTNTFFDYLLYITFFPKILMGPIVKQEQLLPQIKGYLRPNFEEIISGIRMFNIGLFKKVVIADTFSIAVNWLFSKEAITSSTSMEIFLVMLAYSFQIYFDFSGYSDMAIGTGRMMNIRLPQNFDSPYQALSIRDFWKRWHISLTKFLTEYIYIPLGGNRKGVVRTCINVLAVFLISGLWHGANWTFLIWGGLMEFLA